MLNLTARIFAVMVAVGAASCRADVQLPAAVESFTRIHFEGDIAAAGGRFNATDLLDGTPTRRILGYQVGESSVFLWYEHGGRGYHEHLVRFGVEAPHLIEASYVLRKHQHREIESLLLDERLLRDSVARSEEL